MLLILGHKLKLPIYLALYVLLVLLFLDLFWETHVKNSKNDLFLIYILVRRKFYDLLCLPLETIQNPTLDESSKTINLMV